MHWLSNKQTLVNFFFFVSTAVPLLEIQLHFFHYWNNFGEDFSLGIVGQSYFILKIITYHSPRKVPIILVNNIF